MQRPPQRRWPEGQVQAELVQTPPSLQPTLQLPQLNSSLLRSTQVPLQSALPEGHEQRPAVGVPQVPPLQGLPHAPQFAGSVPTLVH